MESLYYTLSLRFSSSCQDDYDFVDPVPAHFNCIICSSLLRRPRLTECCGHHYCDSCLKGWLRGRSSQSKCCPHCRKDKVVHILDKSFERNINELQVRCSNKQKGCKWSGELGDFKYHLNSSQGCDYEEVKCSFDGCSTKVERRSLTEHMNDSCIYRPYTCEFCGHKDTFVEILHHHTNCDCYPLPCPNKCGATAIMRKYMKEHCSNCPLETVSCPFVDTGCSERYIQRKDLENHLKESMQQHMMNLLHSYQELTENNHRLERKIKSLQLSMKVTKSRV